MSKYIRTLYIFSVILLDFNNFLLFCELFFKFPFDKIIPHTNYFFTNNFLKIYKKMVKKIYRDVVLIKPISLRTQALCN